MLDDIAEKFYGVQRRNPMGMFGDIFKVRLKLFILFNTPSDHCYKQKKCFTQKHIILNEHPKNTRNLLGLYVTLIMQMMGAA